MNVNFGIIYFKRRLPKNPNESKNSKTRWFESLSINATQLNVLEL